MIQEMFRAAKDAKCVCCQAPTQKCGYQQDSWCTLPADSDGDVLVLETDKQGIERCRIAVIGRDMTCPLAMCPSCRWKLRRQAQVLNRLDKVLAKEAEEILKRPYRKEFIEASDGVSASMPELPGCFSCGENLCEANTCLHEAALGWLSCVIDSGEAVPAPEMRD
jgi:predicted RNase H-like HicB family nuclease